MNARVLLLVVVTGLFMGAWNGDQAAIQVAVAKRAQLRLQSIAARNAMADTVIAAPVSRLRLASMPVSTPPEPKVAPVPAVPEGESSGLQSDLFPLPETIARGDYQAVSQTGETLRICVTNEASASAGVRDFYMVDAKNGVRWYLVRIE